MRVGARSLDVIEGLGVDAFGPAHERVNDDVELGLLEDLSHHGLVEGLAHLHLTAGNRPGTGGSPPTPSHEEEAVVVADDGTDGHDGPMLRCRSGHGAASGRCMISARAVKPCCSKKFLVARWPGRADASMPTQS